MLSVAVLSIGDAAGWPALQACMLNASLLLCWAVYCMCREGLEIVTYQAYYKRERRREAWGALRGPSPLHARMRIHDSDVSARAWPGRTRAKKETGSNSGNARRRGGDASLVARRQLPRRRWGCRDGRRTLIFPI